MKRLPLALLCAGTVLSLGACGGGGGGGGGGGSTLTDNADSKAAFTHREWAGDDAAMKSAPNALSTAAQTNSALLPKNSQSLMNGTVPTGSSFSLTTGSNGSVTLKKGAAEMANFNASNMNFYTRKGMDFSVMSKTEAKTVSGFDGLVSQTNSLWLGKMDYASFGYWLQMNIGKPTGKAGGVRAYSDRGSFVGGTNAATGFNAGAPLSFTGIAVGSVSINGTGTIYNLPMVGTATLTIVGVSGGNPTGLVLDFPGFYRFDAGINSISGGTFSGKFTGITYKGGWSLPEISAYTTNAFTANTYGPSATNPTEAAGSWALEQSSGGKDIRIGGVFGAKRN